MLGGKWKDYEKEEDNILKRAYMTGHKKAKYSLRGNQYEYDFNRMKQINVESGKERDLRAPYKMKPPSTPIVPSGPTMVVKVPPGGPGTVIQVPHPQNKSLNIAVEVPKTAKVGKAMIVPVPPLPADGGGGAYTPGAAPAAPHKPDGPKDTSLSTGEKVGFAVGGAALIGGMAVAGAVIGDAAADGAFDGTVDAAGDALGDAGDVLADVADDAGDWLMDVGADAGDFIMDLF